MAPRPSGPHLAQRLRALCLSSPPASALFYARLYRALFPPTEAEHDALHILALCLLQADQPYPALHVVRDYADADADPKDDIPDYENGIPARRPGCYGCAVIVAKCCDKLHRYTEGLQVLERAVRRSVPMSLPTPTPAATAATASLLLASLSHKGKASAQAVDHFRLALGHDPWLWEAFTGLCDVGAAPPIDSIFPDPPTSISRTTSQRSQHSAALSPGPMPRSSASEVPNFLSRRQMSPLASGPLTTGFFTPDVGSSLPPAAPTRMGLLGGITWDTPSMMAADTTFPSLGDQGGPSARRPLPHLIQSFLPSASSVLPAALRSTPNPSSDALPSKPPAMKRARGANPMRRPVETPIGGPLTAEPRLNGRDMKMMEPNGDKHIDPPVRRSSRLNAGPGKPPSRLQREREKRSTRSHSVTSSTSGHTHDPLATTIEQQVQAQVDDWLRDVVRRCARAYRYLSLYQCQDALNEIDQLPVEVQSSPWAYDMAARCFYEMCSYVKARRAFKALLDEEPYRLEGLELYSTTLWHLDDPPALSHLSQVLVSIDREAPQPWIAAGNCFSVQREHDEAMRCFRRAAQLDPGCAYAWTLCGHEALEMDEHDRAIAFFRTAIRADSRHYNAWYGMGVVYMKMGKHRHAEHHFRRAAEINPCNSALLCCIGTVLEKLGNYPGALQVYEQACALGDDSAMARFNRTRVLVALGRIDEAILALEPLARETPDEANVHFLLGKTYLRAGRTANAMVAFTSARELQPKLDSAIRATLRARGEDAAEDEGV